MYFLQISDTHHLASYEENKDLFHDVFLKLHPVSDKLDCLCKTNEKKLSFLCHCGDVCHSGKRGDYLAMKAFLQYYFSNIPMIVTMGNHDDKFQTQEVFYNEILDLFAHDVTIDGLRVLSFDNTNGEHSSGEITLEVCLWLLERLKEQPEQDTILVFHHHTLTGQSAMPPAMIHRKFQQVLAYKNIKGILNGHTHTPFQGKMAGIPYYTVGSMSFVGEEKEKGVLEVHESSGYNLFSYENGILSLVEVGELGFQDYLGKANL